MHFFMVPLTKILPPQPLTSKQKVYFYSFRYLAYCPLLFIQFHVFPAATPCGKLQVWLLRATEPPPLCALKALAEALLTKQMSVSRMYALTLMISCAICLVLLISRDILGSLTNEWSVLPLQKLQKRGTVPLKHWRQTKINTGCSTGFLMLTESHSYSNCWEMPLQRILRAQLIHSCTGVHMYRWATVKAHPSIYDKCLCVSSEAQVLLFWQLKSSFQNLSTGFCWGYCSLKQETSFGIDN